MKNKPDISFFFPAYNEEENIPKLIDSAKKVLEDVAGKYEIIIVAYEGATDNTIGIVKEYAKKDRRIRLVVQPKNKKGMGIALRMGFYFCRYNIMFYSDADNQFNLNEFKSFLPHINKYGIIAGYRINRQDPFMRIFVSKCYNLLLKLLFWIREKDVDCAFRLVNKKVLKRIKLNCKTGLGTTELLVKARRKGFKIKEVGVHHYPRTIGKPIFTGNGLNLPKPKVVFDLLREIVKLWYETHIKGG